MRIPSYQKLAQCFEKSESNVLNQVKTADGAIAAFDGLLRGLAGRSFSSQNDLIVKVQKAASTFLSQVPGISIATFSKDGRQQLRIKFGVTGPQVTLGSKGELPNAVLEILEGCFKFADGARGDL